MDPMHTGTNCYNRAMIRNFRDIKAVLFDLDGTLIDSIDHIVDCWQYAMRACLGREVTREDVLPSVGRTLVDAFEAIAPGRSEELLVAYRVRQVATHDTDVTLVPGTLETLEALRAAGLKVGMVTSKGIAVAGRGLDLFGLRPYFDVLVTFEDSTRHKPHPDPLFVACERLGIKPAESVYVGDARWDIEAARAAGMRSVGVTWGAGTEEEIAAAAPDWTVNSMSEIGALVASTAVGT